MSTLWQATSAAPSTPLASAWRMPQIPAEWTEAEAEQPGWHG